MIKSSSEKIKMMLDLQMSLRDRLAFWIVITGFKLLSDDVLKKMNQIKDDVEGKL
jgi:hypothetical protein